MEIKSFNTGRHYSEHGQRIAYCQFDEHLFFFDIDRCIQGYISVMEWETLGQSDIMRIYDYNQYSSIYSNRTIDMVLVYEVMKKLENHFN